MIFVFAITQASFSQVAWLTPENPPIDDTVTLTYNSNLGNGGLSGYDGEIHFHTGAITKKSIDGGDWKHIIGNWGKDDEQTRMTNIGNGLYQYTFSISSFYNLREDEDIQQLAFVFRSANGSMVGKTSNNEDFFLPVNGYYPPAKTEKIYDYNARRYITHFDYDSIVEVITDHGTTQIVPYESNIIEIRHYPQNAPKEEKSDAVILKPEGTFNSIIDETNYLKLLTDSLSVIVNKNPFFISFLYDNDTIIKEEKGYFRRSDTDGIRFEIDANEKIFGLGERAVSPDLIGGRYKLYNRPKYGYEIGAKNLNYSVPLIVSSKKYLLLFDNPQKGYADVGEAESGILEFGAIGGTMKYVVIGGSNHKMIATNYAVLTGFQPLPPIWVLGNLQSRMGYRTQEETDSIANFTIEQDFPLDAMIIDLYWFGDSLLGTMGRLDWYKPNWPNPEKMISDLSKKGIKVVLITEPYILDSIENFHITDSLGLLALDSLGNSYVNSEFYFGDGALIDIFKPEARLWLWDKYKPQIEIGVAGWWGDLGEPENHPSDQIHINGSADEVHNIYGHYWHKALFENMREDYPKMRLFNLNRAGFAGSQRYSIYPWTGDVSRSWGGLQAQVPLMIHMGLCGLPFIHSDAGGFAQGTMDNELYTRWLQMSCFSPILRPHGSDIPSEPVYFNDTTKQIVRKFMQLRYQLLPYIYNLAAEATIKGYPIVRPLFFEFPKDTNTYDIGNEYMFGEDILVFPIVEKEQKYAEIYLPKESDWYSLWDNHIYSGGKSITQKIDLETIPIFIKAGAFIPYTNYVNTTDNYSKTDLLIKYYFDHSDKTNSYTMFEDDGKTYGTIENNNFIYIILEREFISEKKYKYIIKSDGKGYEEQPDIRNVSIEIIGLDALDIDELYLNEEKLIQIKKHTTGNPGYSYDAKKGIWNINFKWDGQEVELIQIGKIK